MYFTLSLISRISFLFIYLENNLSCIIFSCVLCLNSFSSQGYSQRGGPHACGSLGFVSHTAWSLEHHKYCPQTKVKGKQKQIRIAYYSVMGELRL